MTKNFKDHLFSLIKSLSKSEKRQFKLYVGRLGVNEDSKFLLLFNVIDKMTSYNELDILQKGFVTKQQLSNLKAHLYKQILISLRLNPSHQSIRIQIREQLDFATILYSKGLYKQSLKILDKAKQSALLNEEKNVAYEIIELEKVIESQYITRSGSNRAERLVAQSEAVSIENMLASQLSNLSLKLYEKFLKTGYVKNKTEHNELTKYFKTHLPKVEINVIGFREKLWYFKSHLWYSFLTQDFLSCYKYAKKWVELFYENPPMIQLHPVFFLRGNQYLMEALFYTQNDKKFLSAINKFQNTYNSNDFPKDDNIESLGFLYLYSNKFNLCFIKGDFKTAYAIIDDVINGISQFKNRLDQHHIMVLYYKIASVYFCVGDYKKCIHFLDKIISDKSLSMREDLMCFSRILNLVAHYEAALDYNLDSLIKSTYKFLIKMQDLYEVQKEMMRFLRSLPDMFPAQLKTEFNNLHKKLKVFEFHPYERRAFLYLDILSWLESKIKDVPVDQILRQKYLSSKKNI